MIESTRISMFLHGEESTGSYSGSDEMVGSLNQFKIEERTKFPVSKPLGTYLLLFTHIPMGRFLMCALHADFQSLE